MWRPGTKCTEEAEPVHAGPAKPGWKSSQANSPGMESADLGTKHPNVSEGGFGETLSVALLSRNKKECTACSSECTLEPIEHYEHADSMGMKYDGLSVAQVAVC